MVRPSRRAPAPEIGSALFVREFQRQCPFRRDDVICARRASGRIHPVRRVWWIEIRRAARRRGGTGGVSTGSVRGSGGAAGRAATGGHAGGGGSAARDGGADVASRGFDCTLLLGNSTTQQWFDGGFLTYPGIDATRWELIAVAHHYVGAWADANDTAWTTPLDGGHACAQGAQTPDRVIFIVTQSPPYPPESTYQTQTTSVVQNIRTKYPAARQIALATLVRSPGNAASACSAVTDNEQSIPAAEDQAIAAVVAATAFCGGRRRAAPLLRAGLRRLRRGPPAIHDRRRGRHRQAVRGLFRGPPVRVMLGQCGSPGGCSGFWPRSPPAAAAPLRR